MGVWCAWPIATQPIRQSLCSVFSHTFLFQYLVSDYTYKCSTWHVDITHNVDSDLDSGGAPFSIDDDDVEYDVIARRVSTTKFQLKPFIFFLCSDKPEDGNFRVYSQSYHFPATHLQISSVIIKYYFIQPFFNNYGTIQRRLRSLCCLPAVHEWRQVRGNSLILYKKCLQPKDGNFRVQYIMKYIPSLIIPATHLQISSGIIKYYFIQPFFNNYGTIILRLIQRKLRSLCCIPAV